MHNNTTIYYQLNLLLGLANGSDPERIALAKNAIDSGINDIPDSQPLADRIPQIAEQLLSLHASEGQPPQFACCDLSKESDDPLFLWAKVFQSLSAIKAERAFILILGLNNLVNTTRTNWTRKKKKRYRELIDFVESLALKYAPAKTDLKLLVI